ncbi:MAG: peptidase MA family metallohydrolase [Longimicrobiales bacterium]|nr:peptidase MA family metallohydrolase [Longimicrobiales bacterium]
MPPGSRAGRTTTRAASRPGLAALVALVALVAPGAAQETMRAGPVALHYWPEQRALAERVLERLGQQVALPALPPDVLADDTVDVYLAPDAERWDRLTGGAAPEWGAGIARPQEGLIVLPTFDWERTPPHTVYITLRHELAHVALQQYLGPARTPRWFTEGYAQWAAGEWRWESAWRLRLAFVGSDAPPLDSLTLHWPVGELDARLAYLLSASAVAYLVDRSGERGLRIFLEEWRESQDFDAAFRSVYGLTLGQFEEDWRAHVKRSYGWTVLLGQSVFFWLLLAVLLVVLYVVRKRRDRAKLEQLKATEPPDDPAYWERPEDRPGPGPPPR